MEFFIDGKKVRYNSYNNKYLGKGLEVVAYKIDDKAVKFFKKSPGKEIFLTKESIEKMKKIKTKRILLPTDALLDKKHNLRGYQMDYVEDLGSDSYFDLDKDKLNEEHELLRNDIEVLSDNKITLADLTSKNTVYHNGLYLIDPGSYKFDSTVDENQAYGINIDWVNLYLLYVVIRNYHLAKYSGSKNFIDRDFSRKINIEYNKSGKNDVLEFLSDIEEDNLGEFVERRVNKH